MSDLTRHPPLRRYPSLRIVQQPSGRWVAALDLAPPPAQRAYAGHGSTRAEAIADLRKTAPAHNALITDLLALGDREEGK